MSKNRILDFPDTTMKCIMQPEIAYIIDQKLLGRTLIFDLDDTIYNELQFLRQQYWRLAKRFFPSDAESGFRFLIETFTISGRSNLFQKFHRQFKLSVDVSEILDAFRDYRDVQDLSLNCHDWVNELLLHYEEEDPLILITNGNVAQQTEKIRRLRLDLIHPNLMVIFADCFAPKPSRAAYSHLSAQAKLTDPIYIGDSKIDRDFARNCSMEFFEVSTFNISQEVVS